jgi:hypothetical protein
MVMANYPADSKNCAEAYCQELDRRRGNEVFEASNIVPGARHARERADEDMSELRCCLGNADAREVSQ